MSENKVLKEKLQAANDFIKEVANLLSIDTDGVGFDGINLSIDDIMEAINNINGGKRFIIVDPEMYNRLVELSKNMNSQDNRATAMPYIYQVQSRERIPAAEGCGYSAYYQDGSYLETDDEIYQEIYEWFNEEKPLSEIKKMDELEKEEILEKRGYKKVNYDYENKYQNAFLTEKACKEHIQANKHHYSEPVDYLTHAFRNPEMELISKFLCELTGGKIHK